MQGRIVQAVGAVLLGIALLGAVLALGPWLRQRLPPNRHPIAFADVNAEPPSPLSRETFLGEVQYLAGLPDRLDLLDPALPARLARAFAAHPWVESVRRVEVLPPGRVHVDLVLRVPVLAVPFPEDETDGGRRAVDCRGVLLPEAAVGPDLPVLAGAVVPPAGPPGTAWGDPLVEVAAAAVGLLHPQADRLRLGACTVAVLDGDVVLSRPGLRIVWGRPPGRERDGEASAEVKLQRLLDGQELEGQTIDLRSAAP